MKGRESEMDKKKRITIGLLVSGIMDDFTVSVCQGAMKAAKDKNVELVIFPGKYLDRDLTNRKEIMYEYQYNTLFSFAREENLDAILVSADSIGCYTTVERIKRMLSQYAGIPCVLIASKIDGYVSINYDNASGINEAMEYLIHHLECRKIGMIGGPATNTDACERKKAFFQMLKENGLSCEDKLYAEGNLSRHSKEAFQTLLDNNPDIEAVFCVNDDTAIGLYEELRERNLQPGKQVKVFGYDNLVLSAKLKPALSSVWADPVKLGEDALDMVLKMVQGDVVESRILPTKFIRRDSFGDRKTESRQEDTKRLDRKYIDQYFDDIFYRYRSDDSGSDFGHIKEAFRELMEKLIAIYEQEIPWEEKRDEIMSHVDVFLEHKVLDYADMENFLKHVEKIYNMMKAKYPDKVNSQYIKGIFTSLYRRIILAIDQRYGEMAEAQEEKNYDMKLFVKDVMDFERGSDQSYMSLLANLGWLDVKNAYVYVFEKPIMHLFDEEITLPHKLYLKAALNNGEVQSILATSQKTYMKDLFHSEFILNRKTPKVLLPLFSNEMLYGVVLCDMTEKIFEHGDFMVNLFGSAVKMIELLKANDEIQHQLEDSLVTLRENNIALDTLSKSDGLTGILNRRGFYDAAEEFIAKNEGGDREIIVAYIDMNNLKIVNDRYGHDEGDFSIKLIGDMLMQEAGTQGIVGRIGGDEFAMAMFYEEQDRADFVKRIYTKFKNYNETSPKPYNITVSAGICVIHVGKPMTLKEALTRADERLYEEKQHRVKTVAK